MPVKNLSNGQRVKVGNKEGFILQFADKYKIKFDDGSFGFHEESEIEPVVDATRLKSTEQGQLLAEPPASTTDPLAQPVRDTDRSIGDDQEVMGENTGEDVFA